MDHFTANWVRMRANKPPPPAAPQWATPLWCLAAETDRQPHWSQQWGSCHATSYWQPSHLLIACSTFALVPVWVCVCVCVAVEPLMHIINHTYCQALATLPSTQQECVYSGFWMCSLAASVRATKSCLLWSWWWLNHWWRFLFFLRGRTFYYLLWICLKNNCQCDTTLFIHKQEKPGLFHIIAIPSFNIFSIFPVSL